MTAPVAAWKHRLQTAGNVQNVSPDFLTRTPANIKTGAGPQYTAAQLVRVTTDDLDPIVNELDHAATTTGRSSHLFEYDIATPALLVAISNLVNFTHVILGQGRTAHTIKTYIWNAVTLAWEELATSTSSADPRSMTGPVAANFADYVDGSNKLFILIWDYEGVFDPGGGGGCIHANALIHTPIGRRHIRELLPGHLVLGWQDGQLVERMVDEITHHYDQEWDMVRIVSKGAGPLFVTANHEIPTKDGPKRADHVTDSDLLLFKDGTWIGINAITKSKPRTDVYDIICRAPNFFIDGGLAANVMYA